MAHRPPVALRLPVLVEEASAVVDRTKAVSSWSLHRTLGKFVAPGSMRLGSIPSGSAAGLPLLELPAALAGRGFDTLQICHFHLPSRDPGYLSELRSALGAAGVALDALLVDDGDLTDPMDGPDHEDWISGWIEVAEALGATRARVIAGRRPPTAEAIEASAAALSRLADRHHIRVVTENWHELLPDAASVRALLDRTGDRIGLLIDLGNWKGPDKYRQLADIADRAETCHAKCHGRPPDLDLDDYRAALAVLREARYRGPLALVYDGDDPDEWRWLEAEQQVVSEVFAAPHVP
jgi:sugar phosphate isomerase/epimerase